MTGKYVKLAVIHRWAAYEVQLHDTNTYTIVASGSQHEKLRPIAEDIARFAECDLVDEALERITFAHAPLAR